MLIEPYGIMQSIWLRAVGSGFFFGRSSLHVLDINPLSVLIDADILFLWLAFSLC